MSWLTIHMLVELLIAAAFGGLIGWALHALRSREAAAPGAVATPLRTVMSEDAPRIAELETQLSLEREEVSLLKAKVAEGSPELEGSPAWRNRYLESRVRFLEGKLADIEVATAPARPPEDQNDEATQLRWRNRYLEGRVKYLEEELVSSKHFSAAPVMAVPSAPPLGAAQTGAGDEASRPQTLDAPRDGKADDLKEITGIGPKLEGLLNGLGVFHFDQIASWNKEQIDWVNAAISFRGRIERENWVQQAAQLLQGVETDGKRKYREGRQT